MGEQETGGCRFIEHCPLLAHGTIPCIWLKQYCLQTSIDLNSFRFQFAVSLMALKMLALILPVVLAVIPDPDWQAFKNKFQKSYASQNEEAARYKLFVETQARVELLNKLNGEAVFGITWMADRFDEEKYKRGLRKPKNFVPTAPVRNSSYLSRTSHASAVDWRLTEAVTPIKNQGQCGSCWAFSATEAVESQLIMASGGRSDIELSPQQITSCSPSTGTYGCQGCNGGFTEGAYEYLKTAPGLANSFYIPYEQSLTETTETASCPKTKVEAMTGPYEQLSGGYAQVTGYSYAIPPCTEGDCERQDLKGLASALEESPVSICVNAGVWNDYTGGVLTSAACGPMGADYQDHCVMAVGYNSTAPKPYWIVRNSWASTWGMQGYIYLEMDKNTCGLADDVTIPHVKVDMTEGEQIEAAARRAAMFKRASTRATETAEVQI